MRALVNFTYHTPSDDINNSISRNADDSVNYHLTLLTLRSLLLENVKVVDKLIENVNHITDNSVTIDDGHLVVNIESKEVFDNLLAEGVLIDDSENTSENSSHEYQFSEEETNQDRLKRIVNIITLDETDDSSQSESSSESDEVISDNRNIKILLNKYDKFINSLKNDESERSGTFDSD